MKYLNENHLKEIVLDWPEAVGVITDTVGCLFTNEYAQPIKPYLRYKDMKNRIIAMPAYVGGTCNMSGIKWIASFPDNINKGLSRAHSVVILNNADTGKPEAVINTALLSAIRTAAVSGMVIQRFMDARNPEKITLGISGFGPIGRYHLKMCVDILGENLAKIVLYDLKEIDLSELSPDIIAKIQIAGSWMEAYDSADIFITCTVSKRPYIDRRPKSGSLHLNVSLRDYMPVAFDWFRGAIIVDNWEEVCREQTDIEVMHKERSLQQADTQSIINVVYGDCIARYPPDVPVMFNPMGMAVFDIAIGTYFLHKLSQTNHLIELD
ncbi:2,3-diaminopropionate biosynthesis protein SbnB [Chitinophaga polysaccharea]|uniref:2,3-diaminopropionate biosynthesis protein SbnB n=1 Tax=Chitinophaga TaxID=79328 RepID=UPI001455BBB2|nr:MULTISPECIES: 2,3-diaminopropionate biosynthesis protein SbnB [Chitinophaga]NLR57662.1 2,3-diaminopropionate biosynthesis protein SbnB [Chitinophaga polysaccharea]NLU93254.1 2,3-diaminopropionate biosynthesis protein SbnB [Chitinophaga sp. Ak27]